MSVDGTTLIWRVLVSMSPSASRAWRRTVFVPGVEKLTDWVGVSVNAPNEPDPGSHA